MTITGSKTTRGSSSIPATPTPQCARWPAVGCGGLVWSELLLGLNSSGQTLILVTHNPDPAAHYAAQVIEIVDGRVASDAATGARR